MDDQMCDDCNAGIELIKSFFPPGVPGTAREDEPVDSRLVDDDFDPEDYDSVYDYDVAWEAYRWPKKQRFCSVRDRVKTQAELHPDLKLFARLLEVINRIEADVYNHFADVYYKQLRWDCLIWIAQDNIIQELKSLVLETHAQM